MYVQVLQISQRMNAANLYVDLAVCAYCLLPQMILTMTHCLGAHKTPLPQIRFDRIPVRRRRRRTYRRAVVEMRQKEVFQERSFLKHFFLTLWTPAPLKTSK